MIKCIVTRLKNNLIKIINKNQSGFIKGRYIGDNIRSLLEVIDLVDCLMAIPRISAHKRNK
jgi:hypothetical protein